MPDIHCSCMRGSPGYSGELGNYCDTSPCCMTVHYWIMEVVTCSYTCSLVPSTKLCHVPSVRLESQEWHWRTNNWWQYSIRQYSIQGSSYLGHEFNIISKNSFLTPPLPGYDASTYCFDKPWDGSLCVLWDGFMGTYSHTSNGLRCIIICTPLDVANGVLCCNTPSVQRVEGSTKQGSIVTMV